MPVEITPAPAAPAATVVAPAAPATVAPAAPADNVSAPAAPAVVAPATGPEAKPAGSPDATWLASLDDAGRELATKKNWTSAADALKSYSELEKAFSSRDPAKPATYTADDFKFAPPTNAKDIGYSDAFATAYRDMAQKVKGMTPEIAAAVHDWYTGFSTESLAKSQAAYAEKMAADLASVEATLVKEWGAKNNPAFTRNVELATRAMNALGIMDTAHEAGILVKNGEAVTVANAKMFAALAKVGQAMYAEDAIHGAAASGVNPFDPKTRDTAAQGALIKSDPEKALLLIGALREADKAMWLPVLESIKARAAKR